MGSSLRKEDPLLAMMIQVECEIICVAKRKYELTSPALCLAGIGDYGGECDLIRDFRHVSIKARDVSLMNVPLNVIEQFLFSYQGLMGYSVISMATTP